MQKTKPPPRVVWKNLTFAGQTFRIVQRLDAGGHDVRFMQVRNGKRYVPADVEKLDRPTQAFVELYLRELRRCGALRHGKKVCDVS